MDGRACHLELQNGNNSNRIGPWPLLFFFIKGMCLVDMNMFARFDEIPTMKILRKQNFTDGWMDRRNGHENRIHPQTQFAGV